MVKKEMIKMAVIAGAASALKYQEQHPKANEAEIMSSVTRDMREIISKLDEE